MNTDLDGRIFVAGHRGLVGSAIVRRLGAEGTGQVLQRSRDQLDLTDSAQVNAFFREESPDYVFLAAARVGGIQANDRFPADFIRENLAIQLNVMEAARCYSTRKLLFFGSSCIYPKHAPQPIKEEHLLTGPLEETNEAYAVAKIAGIKMAQAYRRQYGCDFISLMPTNLYGPGDDFDLESSHVLPALLRKFHEAACSGEDTVTVWGTGKPRREFLHVDDLADAAVFLMARWSSEKIVNVGVGSDLSIAELADLIASTVGFDGKVEFDRSRPDGTPRKLLDVSRITALGWRPKIPLEEGVRLTYQWLVDNSPEHLPTPQQPTD